MKEETNDRPIVPVRPAGLTIANSTQSRSGITHASLSSIGIDLIMKPKSRASTPQLCGNERDKMSVKKHTHPTARMASLLISWSDSTAVAMAVAMAVLAMYNRH